MTSVSHHWLPQPGHSSHHSSVVSTPQKLDLSSQAYRAPLLALSRVFKCQGMGGGISVETALDLLWQLVFRPSALRYTEQGVKNDDIMRLHFTYLCNQGNKPFKDDWMSSAGVYIYPAGCSRDFDSHKCLSRILLFLLTWDILHSLGCWSCACRLKSRPMMKSLDFSRNNPGVLVITAPGRVNPD